MAIPGQRGRVVGGTTVFHWNDGTGERVIAWADEVRVTGVRPVADAEVLQPLNALRPLEIATPVAHREGRIVLVLKDLYNQAVWQRLAGLASSNDIMDIMNLVAARDEGISISKIMVPPAGIGGSRFDNNATYRETYYNCSVIRADDDEVVNITTMTVNKEMELWFTHSRKHWIPSPTRRLYVGQ